VKTLVLAVAASLALIGCQGGPPTHTVTGTIELKDSSASPDIKTDSTGCNGTGGFGDLARGQPITLKAGDGTIVGAADLDEGKGSTSDCTFSFTMPGVVEVAFYSVIIGSRSPYTESKDTLAGDNWTFSLSIGS
jgi:hypothetical protein